MEPTRGHDGHDALTNKLLLLERSREEWREYDEVMKRQIDEATQRDAKSLTKRKALNELEFMDEKIKLINEMADQMSSDYTKYNKALSVVQDFGKQREEMARMQQMQDEEEARMRVNQEKIRDKMMDEAAGKSRTKFYERKDADAQVKDLKKRVITKKEQKPQVIPRKATNIEKVKESYDDLNEDDDLSSLKDDEEEKIKKILNLDQSLSTTAILKDIFQDEEKMNEKKIIKKPNVKPKKVIAHTPRKQFNKTYEKSLTSTTPLVERKVSPMVSLEREMEGKREYLNKHNSLQREEDAKRLLEDLLVDNRLMQNELNRNVSKSKSPVPTSPSSSLKRRTNTKSRSPTKPKQTPSRIPVAGNCFVTIYTGGKNVTKKSGQFTYLLKLR